MLYDLINPSDAYTFEAPTPEVAALVVCVLGSAYGATPETGDDSVPIGLFGGRREWYEKTFERDPDAGFAALRPEVADALDTMTLGSFADFRAYRAAMDAIDDPVKRDAFAVQWHDRRSSINDIGAAARQYARTIREVTP